MAEVLRLTEVAEYLRVHPSTIYRLLRRKELPAFKVGSDWRFNRASIDQWRSDAETLPQNQVLTIGARVFDPVAGRN